MGRRRSWWTGRGAKSCSKGRRRRSQELGGSVGGVSGDQCWPVGGPLSNPKVGDLDLIKSGGVALTVVHRDQSYWVLDRSIRVLGVSSCLC